jgi:hypothetical protein
LKKASKFQVDIELLIILYLNLTFYLIGIKQIPNVLNEGTPSEAKMIARPKPWEINTLQEDAIVVNDQAEKAEEAEDTIEA